MARSTSQRRKVLRILWPSHCQEAAGWVVGWCISDCMSVATVIADVEMQQIVESKASRSGSLDKSALAPPSPHSLRTSDGMVIKDEYDSDGDDDPSESTEILRPPRELCQKVELLNQDFAKQYWRAELTILGYYDPSNALLRRVRPYGFGTSQESPRPQIVFVEGRSDLVSPQQIVLYDQPRQNDMVADMFEWKKETKAGGAGNGSSNGTNSKPSRAPFNARSAASSEAHATYMASLHQINTARSVEWMLVSAASPLSSELTKAAALRAFSCLHSHYQPILWTISRVQVTMLTVVMWLLHTVHWMLNRRVPILGRPAEYGLLGSFLDKRVVILLNFRDQAERMKTVQYTWQNDATVHRAWIRFYNTSFTMLVDSILGLLAAYVLWTILAPVGFSHATITSHMTTLWGYEWLNDHIRWIMEGAPAGLKLNLATGHALGKVFLFYIEQWSVIVRHLAEATPVVLLLVTLSGAFFGLSMLIILVHDIVYFVNMHIYWLYAAITRVYHVQLVLLRSLWLLFRGKKRNVLKQRIDSCNASLDQLIVGTLLFTSLIFLLPTTGLYYAFFVYAMCLVLALQAAAQLVVNVLNYSPLYAALLYSFRSRTLVGGIQLHSLNATTRLASSTSTTSLVSLVDQAKAASPKMSHSSEKVGSFSNGRIFCTYFQLRTTFISPSLLLADLYKTMALVAANYQLSKLMNSFLFGNTWQNKRFQPTRLKANLPNINLSSEVARPAGEAN